MNDEMKRRLLIAFAILILVGIALYFIQGAPSGRQTPKDNSYPILQRMPNGQAVIQMLSSFETGRIFFKLEDRQFSWHRGNFKNRPVALEEISYFTRAEEPELSWNENVIDQLRLSRSRMHEKIQSGEALQKLDDSLFAWKSFFIEEEEEDEGDD